METIRTKQIYARGWVGCQGVAEEIVGRFGCRMILPKVGMSVQCYRMSSNMASGKLIEIEGNMTSFLYSCLVKELVYILKDGITLLISAKNAFG